MERAALEDKSYVIMTRHILDTFYTSVVPRSARALKRDNLSNGFIQHLAIKRVMKTN
jgi:hypothetical protein